MTDELDEDQPDAISIDSDCATSFNPYDSDPELREKYKRHWKWNDGLWKSRNRVDKNELWRRDRLNLLNSIASELELTTLQKERAKNIIQNINTNDVGTWKQQSLEATCFGICCFVFNEDVKPRREGSTVYLPSKTDENNPDHFIAAKSEIGLTDGEISTAIDFIREVFIESNND